MLRVDLRGGVLTVCLVAGGLLTSCLPQPAGTGESGLELCRSLPPEARETIALVHDGGPFPYPDNDDQHFGNYEGVLPDETLGYYREYTVDTPGVRHRGPCRVVTGGGADGTVDEWFYTDDHYETFCEIGAHDVDAILGAGNA